MRIKHLKINAFGPFKEYNEINFEPLNQKQIFLISGPTGSGKTTIFDAISFALFGSASGETRDDIENVRSDFADPHDETYVECTFEANNRVYTVTRYPQQERLKYNSETEYTKVPTKVELSEAGTTTVLTKVSEVKDKVFDILGITYNQFKQIVMLPQGEFKKLLLASSKDKTTIFRNIFQTHFYQSVQDQLKDMSDELNKKVSTQKAQLDMYFDQIETPHDSNLQGLLDKEYKDVQAILEELDNMNNIQEEKIKQLRNQEHKLSNIIDDETKRVTNIKHTNKQIEDKTNYQNELNQLLQSKDNINKTTKTINYITVAKSVAELEKTYDLYKKQYNDLQEGKLKLEKNITILDKEFKEIETQYKTIPSQKIKRKQKEEEQRLIEDEIELINQIENKDDKIKTLTSKNNKLQKNLQTNQNTLQTIQSTLRDLNNEQTEIEERLYSTSDLKADVTTHRNTIKEYNTLYQEITAYEKQKNTYKDKFATFQNLAERYQKQSNNYITKKAKYYASQAGILAKDLNEGEPCPVCGSTSHPDKALNNDLVTETEFNAIEQTYHNVKEQYDSKQAALKTLLEQLNSKKDTVVNHCNESKFTFNDHIKTTLKDAITNVKEQKHKLETELSNVSKQRSKLQELKQLITDTENKKEQLLTTKDKQTATISSLQGEIKSIQEDRTNLQNKRQNNNAKEDLVSKITVLDKTIKDIQENIDTITTTYNEVKQDRHSKNELLQSNKKQLKKAYEQLLQSKSDFEVALKENFKDEKTYQSYKKQIPKLEELKQIVDTFNEKKNSLTSSINTINSQIRDKQYIDPSPIEKKVVKKKEMLEAHRDSINEIVVTYNQNKKTYKNINTINKKFGALQKKADEAQILADLARGKRANKISFENYVLAYFFSQIIAVANMKLSKMTNERYLLARKEEKSKGGAQQGLDLVVFDSYTSKTRDVSTLSGGETFKASLALALGLAEVIQQNSGGISLETMFIDEGFGTLDPDSLDMAIEELMNINENGRIVGVISHVQELKNRIEARIELKITNEGSKIVKTSDEV